MESCLDWGWDGIRRKYASPGRSPPRWTSISRGYPSEMYSRRSDGFDLSSYPEGSCSAVVDYVECKKENKICILPCGDVCQWQEMLYGFPRVVVHGMDSLCVVARRKDLESVIREKKKYEGYGCNLKNALIYEAEDLALPLGETGKMTEKSFEKPFVAVSVTPCTNEASSDVYHVDSAIEFVKEEMKSGAFTFGKTVKTAIFTLERLFGKKFEAKEIQVFYVQNHTGRVGDSDEGKSDQAKEILTRGERSIMDHLAVVNSKPQSGGSPSQKRGIDGSKKARLVGGSSSRKRGNDGSKKARLVGGSSSRKRGIDGSKKARLVGGSQ